MAEERIPKIVHRLWLGGSEPPPIVEACAASWLRHHPGWEHVLWTDENLPELDHPDLVERARAPFPRFDVIKLELVRQLGGVFVDVDMEALRPLDPLLEGTTAILGRFEGSRVGTQVIGAVPHHPLFELALERLEQSVGIERTANKQAGPAFLTRVVREFDGDLRLLPRPAFFSPLTMIAPADPPRFPEVYAVHHGARTWRGDAPAERIGELEEAVRRAQEEIVLLDRRLAEATAGRKRAERELRRLASRSVFRAALSRLRP